MCYKSYVYYNIIHVIYNNMTIQEVFNIYEVCVGSYHRSLGRSHSFYFIYFLKAVYFSYFLKELFI